ncbi:MAG TPA: type I-C CRISPR-associated protein Cas8c/Csd1 [Gammaproteobacteria bacterium]|nr:type I-C CRISPR-associated protein Cas8c/Csd1 [Gammaproteobacteria bacterium]
MILQSLYQLYDRLADDPGYEIAPPGYSTQKIAFVVVLHPDGRLHEIQDLREEKGKRRVPRQMLVPGQSKPSGSGLNPCFLWDNPFYIFGFTDDEDKGERAIKACQAFRDRHLAVEKEIDDPAFSAVCRFLESWDPAQIKAHSEFSEIGTGFGVFQIIGETGYVHERPRVRDWWAAQQGVPPEGGHPTMCLITGERAMAARTHEPKLKGVPGAQSSGATLVSFNCDAFTSYGKDQSLNSPVSEQAAFRYCTALNAILSGPRSDRHRFSLGDTTVVFWTDKPTTTEIWLADLFGGTLEEGAQDEGALEQTHILLEALRKGGGELRLLGDDPDTPVHLLGLAPNAARLAVRFWHTGTLRALFDRLKAHHDALRMVRQFEAGSKRPDPEFPPLWMLLRETARENKDIPPLLGGALLRAVIGGGAYPEALAAAVIRRIRADHTVNYLRAAILKSWLTRNPNRQGEIPVSLDTQRNDPAYRLGRLFAVLEKTQEDAQPGINATIRDRFYSAASATPAVVFPRILGTYQHHLAKLPIGQKITREKLVQEIMVGIDVMPSHLSLQDQAQFAIGYYHQRKALFTKTEPETGNQE